MSYAFDLQFEPYASRMVRCYRHRTGDEVPAELRDADVPPYECCDCIQLRDEHLQHSLDFQDRMDRGIGEFERRGGSSLINNPNDTASA
jgi:hypothetical protein